MRRYEGHDVGYGETRDGDGRVPRHRPANCGMPVAGYMVSSGRRRNKRHRRACLGVDRVSGVSPRQAVENNAPFSLSHAKTGYMVRSVRLIPRSSVSPAKESDRCGSRVKRVVTRSDDKAEKDGSEAR